MRSKKEAGIKVVLSASEIAILEGLVNQEISKVSTIPIQDITLSDVKLVGSLKIINYVLHYAVKNSIK